MSKTIIITGTSSGVGFALGNYFHEKGCKVFGLSRKIPEGAKFKTIPTDITNIEQIREAFEKIQKETNKIDLLINNAGRGMVGAVEDSKSGEILDLFNLNLAATANMISYSMPFLKESEKGFIFNISSIGSVMGLPFRGFYSASKAAVDMMTEALRYEILNTKIQACTINLGDVATNIAESRIKSSVSSDYKIAFDKVYDNMNTHVNKGISPKTVGPFIEKLINKSGKLKPHYYFGPFDQKLSLFIKSILPQKWFEKIIKMYSGL